MKRVPAWYIGEVDDDLALCAKLLFLNN
jgi:hypothetical protein